MNIKNIVIHKHLVGLYFYFIYFLAVNVIWKFGMYDVKKGLKLMLELIKSALKEIIHFYFIYLKCFACMCYVYHGCAWCQWRPEKIVRFIRTGVTHNFKLPCGYWELNLGPLGAASAFNCLDVFPTLKILYLCKDLMIPVAYLHMAFLVKETKIRSRFMEQFSKSSSIKYSQWWIMT